MFCYSFQIVVKAQPFLMFFFSNSNAKQHIQKILTSYVFQVTDMWHVVVLIGVFSCSSLIWHPLVDAVCRLAVISAIQKFLPIVVF